MCEKSACLLFDAITNTVDKSMKGGVLLVIVLHLLAATLVEIRAQGSRSLVVKNQCTEGGWVRLTSGAAGMCAQGRA